jgi:hypothetical protein
MPRKRGPPGVSQDGVPRDPRGRVKAGLLEVQSRSEYAQSRCDTDSARRHQVPGIGWKSRGKPA